MAPWTSDELGEIADRRARVDWMRAEFRTAQQRRYDKVASALEKTPPAIPEPAPKPEPPTLVTRSR